VFDRELHSSFTNVARTHRLATRANSARELDMHRETAWHSGARTKCQRARKFHARREETPERRGCWQREERWQGWGKQRPARLGKRQGAGELEEQGPSESVGNLAMDAGRRQREQGRGQGTQQRPGNSTVAAAIDAGKGAPRAESWSITGHGREKRIGTSTH
jgi:hypothetical protein